MVNYALNTVTERDMDLLFSNALASDPGFLSLFVSKAGITCINPIVTDVIISKTETRLGESDITLHLDLDGKKYGFLIEDKIDAINMPDQYRRYVRRGERGVQRGDYDRFEVFIVCPAKYYEGNDEAKKYNHFVSYEECREYFVSKEDPVSRMREQQLLQALDKAHRPAQVIIDERANIFFRQYKAYQEDNYPELDLRTSSTSNGYWAHYSVRLKNAYIYHKIGRGDIDLNLTGAADMIEYADSIVAWLNTHGLPEVKAYVTGKSASIRITAPVFDMQKPFEECLETDLRKCFEAICTLVEVAHIFELARRVADHELL